MKKSKILCTGRELIQRIGDTWLRCCGGRDSPPAVELTAIDLSLTELRLTILAWITRPKLLNLYQGKLYLIDGSRL